MLILSFDQSALGVLFFCTTEGLGGNSFGSFVVLFFPLFLFSLEDRLSSSRLYSTFLLVKLLFLYIEKEESL